MSLSRTADLDRRAFVRANTVVTSPPLVPELRLHLASEVTPLWQATEDAMERTGLSPPFWGFCWPGSQALARYLLDNPAVVAGRRVLDFASGCGVAAIAAAKAGAAVTAADTDPFAAEAIHANARLNDVDVGVTKADLVDADGGHWDVILAGDVCYERPMTERVVPWLRRRAHDGAAVLLADPGRAYLPKDGLAEVARYTVPTSLELETRESLETVVWRL